MSWESEIDRCQMEVNKISHGGYGDWTQIRTQTQTHSITDRQHASKDSVAYIERNMVLMRVKGAFSHLRLWVYQPLSLTKDIDRCHSLQRPVIDTNNNVEMKKPTKSLRCNNRNI